MALRHVPTLDAKEWKIVEKELARTPSKDEIRSIRKSVENGSKLKVHY
ncbi:MAG: hypothetical protein ACRDFB_03175 [Rhabdochlamydiaceae bacterium]